MVTQDMQELAYKLADAAREAGNKEMRFTWFIDAEYAWTLSAEGLDGISHLVFGPEKNDEG